MRTTYIFTGDTKQYCGHTLKRIMATAANTQCPEGTIGGWIENESNLEDGAWVANEAMVFGYAVVKDSSLVKHYAKVYDSATVYGLAVIHDHAEVYGNAKVYGDAQLTDNCKVYGDAKVYGLAEVNDRAVVCEGAEVHGYSIVEYNAVVRGHAEVKDYAHILECASVRDYALVCDHAIVGAATVGGKTRIDGSAEIRFSAIVNNAVGYNVYRYVDANDNVRLLTYTASNKGWVTSGFHGNSTQLLEFADGGAMDLDYTIDIIDAQSRVGNDDELRAIARLGRKLSVGKLAMKLVDKYENGVRYE